MTATHRYVDVVFQQGDDAAETLALLDDCGEHAALDHLIEWDFGVETEIRAEYIGRINVELATVPGERTYSYGEYVMTYNLRRGYVGLSRIVRHGDSG